MSDKSLTGSTGNSSSLNQQGQESQAFAQCVTQQITFEKYIKSVDIHNRSIKEGIEDNEIIVSMEIDPKDNQSSIKGKDNLPKSFYIIRFYPSLSLVEAINSEASIADKTNSVFLILKDITDTLQVKELRKQMEEKDLILATVTHDMRTPLFAIEHTLTSIKSDQSIMDSLQEDMRELVNSSRTSCDLLNFLINDIIDAARLIKTGQVKLNPELTSISDLFNDVFVMMKSRFKERNLGFETIIDDNTPEFLLSDRIRIKQIILNFLTNSLKFTTRGKVTLSARRFKNYSHILEIAVKDTGVGIKEVDQKKIFEKFFTTGGQKNKNGVGLGLSICKKLAGLLGPSERIFFVSRYNKGSKFWVRIYTDIENKFSQIKGLDFDDSRVSADISMLSDSRNIVQRNEEQSDQETLSYSEVVPLNYNRRLLCMQRKRIIFALWRILKIIL